MNPWDLVLLVLGWGALCAVVLVVLVVLAILWAALLATVRTRKDSGRSVPIFKSKVPK